MIYLFWGLSLFIFYSALSLRLLGSDITTTEKVKSIETLDQILGIQAISGEDKVLE